MAKGGGLVSGDSQQLHSSKLWLDYQQTAAVQGKEARLSRLATWLLEAENRLEGPSGTYGLKLPGLTVACGRGAAHLRECLDALATWPHAAAGSR